MRKEKMMKGNTWSRLISIALICAMVFCLSTVCFAEEPTNITPRDNKYYTEVVTDTSWRQETTFTITYEEAANRSKLEGTISLALAGCSFVPGVGMIASVAGMGLTAGSMSDPFKDYGKYVVKTKNVKTYQVNRLTGQRSLIETKKLTEVTFTQNGGKSTTKTFTLNMK